MLFFFSILPIPAALVLMTKFKMKPGMALPFSLALTALFGYFVWDMPIGQICAVSLFGILKSLDIILIVFSAVFLLNILKRNHSMEIINNTFAGISPDRRIQMVIIAWLFSSFIEGAAGFGSAPALAAPLLAGLGFPVITAKTYDRLGLTEETTDILGIQVPSVTIPVGPGRNLAIIVEAAAINYRVKKMGYNAAQDLVSRVFPGKSLDG